VAAALFVAVPIVAFARSKPTIEDAQKLVEKIISDKNKLKAYCEISKLHEQLDNAEEKGDAQEFETLVGELDSLEQQMDALHWVGRDWATRCRRSLRIPRLKSTRP
jgi:hypothetical protein